MFKLLGALTIIGAAWAGSHYLTPTFTASDSEPAAPKSADGAAPGTNSVALLDLAVAVLPQRQADATDFAPVEVPAPAVAVPPPIKAEVTPAIDVPAVVEAENDGDLARRLQVELRRVGCLKTGADGVWGPASQRAMQRFANRIDASLPTSRPDAVLLMLVEKFADRACGSPCAKDAQPDARGQCHAREEVATVQSGFEQVAAAVESDASIADLAPPTASRPVVDVTKTSALKPAVVKTRIARAPRSKMARLARVKARRTVWSSPVYSLGMIQAKPLSTVKKRKRVGASAAYRRWMHRTGMSMR